MAKDCLTAILTLYGIIPSLLHLLRNLDLIVAISDDVPKCPKNMSGILKAEGVVPDVIDNVPKHHIEIEYNQHCFINFGNMLGPEEVYWRTFAIDWHCVRDTFFTFLLVGPDEPTRSSPTDREFLYWLIVNIPIDAVICGDCLAEYIPPSPKKGTGIHRYVYVVLYQTKGKMKFDEPYLKNTSIAERKRWSTKLFMKKYGFEEAHAVNFFKSEWSNPSMMTTKDPFDIQIPRRRGRQAKKKVTTK